MKYDPVNQVYYDHTPDEWLDVMRRHGSGFSVTGRLATQLVKAKKKQAKEPGGGS